MFLYTSPHRLTHVRGELTVDVVVATEAGVVVVLGVVAGAAVLAAVDNGSLVVKHTKLKSLQPT